MSSKLYAATCAAVGIDGDDLVASGFPRFVPSPLAGEGGGAPAPGGVGTAPQAAAGAADPSPHPSPAGGEGARGRVLINPDQGFDGVPALAWSFPIGGYLPAQKWLKDRRGRALSYEDTLHYQKILKILAKTDRIMREIELPLEPS